MKKTISCIVPVYNTLPYLEACVNSVLAQTMAEWELILIDDGSTDGSARLCDSLAARDPRVRVLHQKNSGVSAARNRGIELASGDYLMFADSDDRLEPELFDTCRRLLETSAADLAGCAFLEDRKEGTVYPCRELGERVFAPEEFLYRVISNPDCGVRLSCWGWLYPRTLIGETRFDPTLAYGEDSLFLATILKKCRKIFYEPTPLYRYRVDREGNTVGVISLQKSLRVLQSWNRMAAQYPEPGKLSDYLLKLRADHGIRCAAQAHEEGCLEQEKELKTMVRELSRQVRTRSGIGKKDKLRIRLFAQNPAGMMKLYCLLTGKKRG